MGHRDAATSQGEPVVRDRPGAGTWGTVQMGDFQWEFHGKTKHFIQKYMMESCSMGKIWMEKSRVLLKLNGMGISPFNHGEILRIYWGFKKRSGWWFQIFFVSIYIRFHEIS